MRARARRLAFGLSTILGLKQRGFFIPYRHADLVTDWARRQGYPALEPIFVEAELAFSGVLERIDAYAVALATIGGSPPEPRWDQDWFPRLDAAAAYVLVREARPRRIVEVGSGHSTRFLCRAVRDADLDTELTAIDPAPRASLDGLEVRLIRATLQQAETAAFDDLRAGDLLVVDSSHILMPGTDVDILLNLVLPRLPSGVLLHVHDIFLPDAYPPEWDWRGYNEQLAVATLIQGGAWRLLWSSRYAVTRMADAVERSAVARIELNLGALESSLWLVKA